MFIYVSLSPFLAEHYDAKHPREVFDESVFVDLHELHGGTTKGIAVSGRGRHHVARVFALKLSYPAVRCEVLLMFGNVNAGGKPIVLYRLEFNLKLVLLYRLPNTYGLTHTRTKAN